MKSKTIFKTIIVLVISLTLIIATIYIGGVLYIKKHGLTLTPSKVIAPQNISIFLQNDPQWKNDKIGNTKLTLGKYGCLISVITSTINNLGQETDVKKINTLFTENNVYTAGSEVIWKKINTAIPEVDYYYQRIFFSSTIEKDLENGLFPIVKVKYLKTGIYHWVLIVGSNEKDFLIIDPLKQDKKITTLSTHGNVFAYRVLYQKNTK